MLAVEFCGLRLRNPLVLLSGCVGFGREYDRVQGFSNALAGAVCLKGTTLKERLGNQPHRMAETPSGMLNSIGLQNPGAHHVLKKLLPLLHPHETHYIANISGATVEEFGELAALFDDSPVSAIEINVSCPNVRRGGMEFGNDPELCARVIELCKSRTGKPLITKLSPNQTDVAANARRCLEAGSDAFAVINTVAGMAIDPERRRPILGYNQGGLSGPAVKPIALLKVHEVYQVTRPHGVPIIGQGGICGVDDALEFLIAGATAVGLGTGLFYDPLLCGRVNEGLLDYLRRHHFRKITELTGSLRLHDPARRTDDSG